MSAKGMLHKYTKVTTVALEISKIHMIHMWLWRSGQKWAELQTQQLWQLHEGARQNLLRHRCWFCGWKRIPMSRWNYLLLRPPVADFPWRSWFILFVLQLTVGWGWKQNQCRWRVYEWFAWEMKKNGGIWHIWGFGGNWQRQCAALLQSWTGKNFSTSSVAEGKARGSTQLCLFLLSI